VLEEIRNAPPKTPKARQTKPEKTSAEKAGTNRPQKSLAFRPLSVFDADLQNPPQLTATGGISMGEVVNQKSGLQDIHRPLYSFTSSAYGSSALGGLQPIIELPTSMELAAVGLYSFKNLASKVPMAAAAAVTAQAVATAAKFESEHIWLSGDFYDWMSNPLIPNYIKDEMWQKMQEDSLIAAPKPQSSTPALDINSLPQLNPLVADTDAYKPIAVGFPRLEPRPSILSTPDQRDKAQELTSLPGYEIISDRQKWQLPGFTPTVPEKSVLFTPAYNGPDLSILERSKNQGNSGPNKVTSTFKNSVISPGPQFEPEDEDKQQPKTKNERYQNKINNIKGQLFERPGKTKQETTLRAAKIESQGKQIDLAMQRGVEYNHIEKVQNAEKGLERIILRLKQDLGNPNISLLERKELHDMLSESSKLLDLVKSTLFK
jgi:hypothetical protein